jgi:hypothetical protein
MRDSLDLDTYPLDRPDSDGYRALVERCRADLVGNGMFTLPGFMRPDIAQAAAQALLPRFATESFRHERRHNIYFQPAIPDLPVDHPALTEFQTSNDTLCLDQMPDSAMAALYDWPPFARFLADTMGKDALYPMADPLAGVNVMSYAEGQSLNWHFDRSEFTTTLLLQAPETGGEFVYRTDLRTETDANYDGVARLLRGEDPQVRVLRLTPGALNVFRGKNTPHRTADVRGSTARVIAVFSFYDRPGVCFSEAERIGFYGRAR